MRLACGVRVGPCERRASLRELEKPETMRLRRRCASDRRWQSGCTLLSVKRGAMKQATRAAPRCQTLSFEDEAPSGTRQTAKRASRPSVALSAVPRIALRGTDLRAQPIDH